MPVFANADELYAILGKLFQDLAADEEMSARFRQANTIVRYQQTDPEAAITVRLQPAEPVQVDLGKTDMEPQVTMTMSADTAHRFWLGQVNVTVALARGEIKATGPVAKILKLVPLTKPVFPRYRALLLEQGRADLLEGLGD